jgi:hypothetical protein
VRSSKLPTKREKLLDAARQYLGYKTELGNRSMFGLRVGYETAPWSGAFIDVIAREAGLHVPSCVYTPTALADFIKNGQLTNRPQEGDLVFFNFSSKNETASAFHQPHIGLVVDVREYKSTGRFLTIEGDATSSKQSTGSGVHMKTRYSTDVVAFARPEEFNRKLSIFNLLMKLWKLMTVRTELDAEDKALFQVNNEIRIKSLQPGKRNRDVEVLQAALGLTVGLKGAARGIWDAATANAFMNFQRKIGYVGPAADGIPEARSLQRLADDSGLFKIKA